MGRGGTGGAIPPNQNFKAKVLNFAVLSFGPRILSFSFKFWSKFRQAFSRYDLGDKVEENDKRTCLEEKFFSNAFE